MRCFFFLFVNRLFLLEPRVVEPHGSSISVYFDMHVLHIRLVVSKLTSLVQKTSLCLVSVLRVCSLLTRFIAFKIH